MIETKPLHKRRKPRDPDYLNLGGFLISHCSFASTTTIISTITSILFDIVNNCHSLRNRVFYGTKIHGFQYTLYM